MNSMNGLRAIGGEPTLPDRGAPLANQHRAKPKRCRRRNRPRRGAVLVEAAIAIPVLFLMLVGFIAFSQWYLVEHSMLQAAREGARALAVQDATIEQATQRTTAVLRTMLPEWKVSQCTVACQETVVDGTKRDAVVTIQIPVAAAWIFGDPFGFLGDSTLDVQAVMRDEEQ